MQLETPRNLFHIQVIFLCAFGEFDAFTCYSMLAVLLGMVNWNLFFVMVTILVSLSFKRLDINFFFTLINIIIWFYLLKQLN